MRAGFVPGVGGGFQLEGGMRDVEVPMQAGLSGDITAIQAHKVAVNAEHDLLHAWPRLPVRSW